MVVSVCDGHGTGGTGLGRCHLLSMVVLAVVGGIVNLKDVVVVVEESSNVMRCNIDIVLIFTCRCSQVKITCLLVVSCLAMF
jgi:hypothetical protein